MNKKISVIVPVYNSEKYLENCLQSIVNQVYKDFELIIVDDGSTDNSGIIINKFEKKHDFIKTIHQENKGVSCARNEGIINSNGEYVCFVDSDDIVSELYLSHLIDIVLNKKTDWALTAVDNYKNIEENQCINIDLNNISSDLFYLLNKEYVVFGPCCKLYKRKLLIDNNICFPADISCGEDLIFNFKYMSYIRNMVFVNICDYSYQRINDESLSKRFRLNMFDEEIELYKVKKEFYDKKQVYNNKYKTLLFEAVFDVGYNAILQEYCNNVTDNRYEYIHHILNNPYFIEALEFIDATKYSGIIIWLFKRRYIRLLLFYLKLRIKRN